MKKEILENIAKEILDIETLSEQGLDDLDFHERSVLQIKEALAAAFKAGQQSITNK